MKIRRLPLVTVPAAAGLAAAAAFALPQDAPKRGLVNVFPDGVQQSAEPFDAAASAEALADPDLDRREQAFADVVRRARRDPDAKTWLADTAAGADRELAWTARLALRELERTRPRSPFDVWSGKNDLDEFDSMIEEFTRRIAPGWNHRIDPFVIPFPGLAPQTPLSPGQISARARSVDIHNDADGWTVRVRETVDGEEEVREYKGATLEEILEANPELKQEVGVDGALIGPGFSLRIGSPGDQSFDFESLLENFGVRPGFGSWREDQDASDGPAIRTDVLGVLARPAQEAEGGVGLYVRGTLPRTIASMLGIVSGDVLLEINGRKLVTVDDVTAALDARGGDGKVEATWIDATGRRRTGTWMP